MAVSVNPYIDVISFPMAEWAGPAGGSEFFHDRYNDATHGKVKMGFDKIGVISIVVIV